MLNWRRLFNADQEYMLFISDSEKCPCKKQYYIAKSIKGIKALNISNINYEEEFHAVENKKKLIIYVHGDKIKLQCFYFRESITSLKQAYIPNNWWKNFHEGNRLTYFHVCSGAKILQRDLKNFFSFWVSYNDDIVAINGSDYRIKDINRKFLLRIWEQIKKRENPMALKKGIESAYMDIESDLRDIRTDKFIPGFTAFIHAVGTNSSCIQCSLD